MPVCCVKGCSSRYNKNQPQLSLHKMPQNELRKEKWLRAIGKKNINDRAKMHFVCSLHFHESCFNRSLDQVRLRDDAVPSIFSWGTEETEEKFTEVFTVVEIPITPVRVAEETKPDITHLAEIPIMPKYKKTILKLSQKSVMQRKKIKLLQDRCRRQAKKICNLNSIIDTLKGRLSSSDKVVSPGA